MMGFQSGDEKRMTAPLDYIGVNYYSRRLAATPTTPVPSRVCYDAMGFEATTGKEGPLTDNGWEVYPRGMYDIVQRVSKDYKLPIEITENGCSYGDYPDATGRVADNRRIYFYREHLRELARAIHDGADVRGYHAWSILDNFEWGEGYTQRFGLVYVDFSSQRRYMKDSAKWYSKIAAVNAV
jgi:beta-glucosidase